MLFALPNVVSKSVSLLFRKNSDNPLPLAVNSPGNKAKFAAQKKKEAEEEHHH
jgi:hypothetical protein